MDQKYSKQLDTYQIRIKGALNPAITDFLGDIIIIRQENGKFPGQSALRGFLDHLWNLNFNVLSVEKIDAEKDQVNEPRYQPPGALR
jgi:hypothetical protein